MASKIVSATAAVITTIGIGVSAIACSTSTTTAPKPVAAHSAPATTTDDALCSQVDHGVTGSDRVVRDVVTTWSHESVGKTLTVDLTAAAAQAALAVVDDDDGADNSAAVTQFGNELAAAQTLCENQ